MQTLEHAEIFNLLLPYIPSYAECRCILLFAEKIDIHLTKKDSRVTLTFEGISCSHVRLCYIKLY